MDANEKNQLDLMEMISQFIALLFSTFIVTKMASLFPLIEELERFSRSDGVNDQLVVLFQREDVGKIEEIRRLCIELRANIRLRKDYISELRLYRSCDPVLGAIEMLWRMQSDDMENVARLLSMARVTQQRADEVNAFIVKLKDHGVV